MKPKDVPTLIVAGIISAVLSIVLSNILISSDKNRSEKTEIVKPINSELSEVSTEYFNADSTNPTQTIQIGEDSSALPFGGE